MTIHLIAKELYRLIREIEGLQAQRGQASPGETAALDAQIRKLQAERDRLRGIIDGHKRAH